MSSFPTVNYLNEVKAKQDDMMTLFVQDFKAVDSLSQIYTELGESNELTDLQNNVINITMESIFGPRGWDYSRENLGITQKAKQLKALILKFINYIRTQILRAMEWINKKLFKTKMRRDQLRKSIQASLTAMEKDQDAVYRPVRLNYEAARFFMRGGELSEDLAHDLKDFTDLLTQYRKSPIQRTYGLIVAKLQTFNQTVGDSEAMKLTVSDEIRTDVQDLLLQEWIPSNKNWTMVTSYSTADLQSTIVDELLGMKAVVKYVPANQAMGMFREGMKSGYELDESGHYTPELEQAGTEISVFDYESSRATLKQTLKLLDELDEFSKFFKNIERTIDDLDRSLDSIVKELSVEQSGDVTIAGFLFYLNALIRSMNGFPIELYAHGMALTSHIDNIYKFMLKSQKTNLKI